jgi:hypothetical protein
MHVRALRTAAWRLRLALRANGLGTLVVSGGPKAPIAVHAGSQIAFTLLLPRGDRIVGRHQITVTTTSPDGSHHMSTHVILQVVR